MNRRVTDKRILVVAATPRSAEARRWIKESLGTDVEFTDLTTLRRSGIGGMLRAIRNTKCQQVIAVGSEDELRVFRDYLVTLAFLFPARVRKIQWSATDVVDLRYTHLIAAGLRVLAGLAIGLLSVPSTHLDLVRARYGPEPGPRLPGTGRCLYLKPTLSFGASVGGSVAHVSGVVNGLLRRGVAVRLLASQPQPLVEAAADQIIVYPNFLIAFPYELNQRRYQRQFLRAAAANAREFRPEFIYQRYALNDMTGVLLRAKLGIPLVLEFNGSEVWVQRNWGRPLRFESMARRIEQANLRAADVVVAVSEELVRQAVSLGAPRERVLFYPNCIDPAICDPGRFSAEDRQRTREALGIPHGADLFTFVGTFGQWHGTDVLAAAIRLLIDRNSEWLHRRRVHFLYVGDGHLAPKVRSILGETLGGPFVTLAGLWPQAETLGILAASDVLLSPHVPNADGTPFFGSPTKLFEYMAMEKLIVASDLDQIGRALRGWQPGSAGAPLGVPAAILVQPGNVPALVEGIRQAAEMTVEQRFRFGKRARDYVLRGFTWDRHVEAILPPCDGEGQHSSAADL